MKHKYTIGLAIATAAILSACSSFLDVSPEDKFLDRQVYSDEAKINQTLNGFYVQMAETSLYGATLTSTYIEILGQQYNIPTGYHEAKDFQTYTYTQTRPRETFATVWEKSYSLILQINLFIESLSATEGVVIQDKKDILLGEAYAMRALLHFDLFRLFGPLYDSETPATSIPYYDKADVNANGFLSSDKFMECVIADLLLAEDMLKNDPVITGGIQDELLDDGKDFYRYRNRRLNYYAVKGLQARAYLCCGDTGKAHTAAKKVIDDGGKWFPWLEYSKIVSEQNNPDRIFSPEIIFGLISKDIYNVQARYFNASLGDSQIMAVRSANLPTLFESNDNDYRYKTTWKTTEKTYPTFFKYADVASSSSKFRNFQPMLRKSEMYYILAETETDGEKAIGYLNEVRANRGLVALPVTANIATELQKEYRKEFLGEGQLFFFYKRRNVARIPSGISSGTVTMDATKYVVPIPEDEMSYRKS